MSGHELSYVANRHFSIALLNEAVADLVNAHARLDITSGEAASSPVRVGRVCTAPRAPAATTRAPSRQAGWAVIVQRRLVARVRATYKSLSPPGRAVMISSGFMTTTPSNSRPRASDAGTMRAW